jgi:hypothetical protein
VVAFLKDDEAIDSVMSLCNREGWTMVKAKFDLNDECSSFAAQEIRAQVDSLRDSH